jgi:death-on-curing protein
MDYSGPSIAFPSFSQICDINRKMIEKSGGLFSPPDNLMNSGALKYILAEVVNSDPQYIEHSVLKRIAARISHCIMSRHVFNDGNKRTGVQIAWEFLQANTIRIILDSSIINLAQACAINEANVDDLFHWLMGHQE